MIKKYALWQTRRWLPLFGLIAIAFAGFFLFPAALSNIDLTSGHYYGNAFSFTPIIQVGLIATIVVPFFVFSYRFSRKSADAFMQFAVPERKIKNIRVLLGLLAIMIPFVAVFWLGTMIVAIRQAVSPRDYWYDYGWITLGFLYLMVAIPAAYFVICAILSVANNPIDGALAIAIVQVLLLLTIEPFSQYIKVFDYSSVPYFNISSYNLTLWSVSSSFSFLFSNMIEGQPFSESAGWATAYTFEAIYIPLFLVLGSLAMVFTFRKKDPSGESFGDKGYDMAWPKYSIHVLMGSFAFLIATIAPQLRNWDYSSTNGLLIFTVSVIGWSLGYYAILAIQERSFRIPKKELLIGMGELALLFALTLPVSLYQADAYYMA